MTTPLTLARLATASILAASLGAPAFASPEVKLRIATQAPKGTVWMDALYDIKKKVEKGTKKRIEIDYFTNGTMGDEKVVVEKMEMGTLHGGLFTGIGLGEILPKIRILEVPFLYENKKEIDAMRTALEPELVKGFAEKGFTFLGWAEVGWAYIFSKRKPGNLAELRKRKIWLWQATRSRPRCSRSSGSRGSRSR